ncbi:MAG: glycoside hydrolase family 15 protein [Acidobacteriaceae bacterium]
MDKFVRTGEAPTGPADLGPTWSSSAKDLVTTALGSSRIWATVGYGILNEVYWPSTGSPQIRDMGFIVAGPHGWSEVKRIHRYTVTTPQPDIPLPTAVHDGDNGVYRLTLEVVPDPSRDTLLIRYALEGDGCQVYVLLAPRLGRESGANSAWSGDVLMAQGGDDWLCLAASHGYQRSSAGYVGTSDGWQDFDKNGCMEWEYDHAGPGNVALMAELTAPSGVLALAFSFSREGAVTLAKSSLSIGYPAIRRQAHDGWADWARNVRTVQDNKLPADLLEQAKRSAAVLKVHEDRTFPGAVVASLSIPWGNAHNDLGGYHLVWARDAVNSGLGLLAMGQVDDARRMLAYLIAMQNPDGHWAQNFYPDGRPFWKGIQLDEIGFPILLATKLLETGQLENDEGVLIGVRSMVGAAARYIVRNGPVTPQDRWEEDAGLNGFTLAVLVAALVAAGEWLQGEARAQVLRTADDWNARIEDWTYAEGTSLAKAHGVVGHYVRIAPEAGRSLHDQRVSVQNRGGMTIAATNLVAMDYLALARFGLRDPKDPKMVDTTKVCEAELGTDTPMGRVYHRYNEDGYGEHADGSPFNGTGVGRGWPLLTGERGHLALMAGEDARPYLVAMARMTGPCGMIPEQVWDTDALPGVSVAPGKPTGSAMPLVWAHSEYLKLTMAIETGRPIELLECVKKRYGGKRPEREDRLWRSEAPVAAVPKGSVLRIEDLRPFVLRYSRDNWATVEEITSVPLAFDMEGVMIHLGSDEGSLVFTRHYSDGWEGQNHAVAFI